MQKPLTQITTEWMEARRADIINKQRTLGMRASGRTAASLETEEKGPTVNLIGDPSFNFQEYGRGPTKRKGPIPLYLIIRQWMKDKGLRADGGFNEYSIANKIHAMGTRIHRKEAQPLGITEIVDNNLPELEDELGLFVVGSLESEILRQFKKIQ